MYNPYPYDDPRAINKPVLAPQTIESVTAGTPQAAVRLAREFAETLKATPQRNLIVAFDGYTTPAVPAGAAGSTDGCPSSWALCCWCSCVRGPFCAALPPCISKR